jgi:hypothetical protein
MSLLTCPCCIYVLLLVHACIRKLNLHALAACPAFPCFLSTLLVHAAGVCCMFVHTACPCLMSMLHVHTAGPCCMSLVQVHVHASFPCYTSMF